MHKITEKCSSLLEKKRKRYRNNLIVYLLAFIPCVLALIGFNLLLLYPTTNFFLALIVAVLGQFAFSINVALIGFGSLMGLAVALTTRGYITTKRRIKRFEGGKPEQSLQDDATEKNEIYESLARSEEKRKKLIKYVSLVFILSGVILYSFYRVLRI